MLNKSNKRETHTINKEICNIQTNKWEPHAYHIVKKRFTHEHTHKHCLELVCVHFLISRLFCIKGRKATSVTVIIKMP